MTIPFSGSLHEKPCSYSQGSCHRTTTFNAIGSNFVCFFVCCLCDTLHVPKEHPMYNALCHWCAAYIEGCSRNCPQRGIQVSSKGSILRVLDGQTFTCPSSGWNSKPLGTNINVRHKFYPGLDLVFSRCSWCCLGWIRAFAAGKSVPILFNFQPRTRAKMDAVMEVPRSHLQQQLWMYL